MRSSGKTALIFGATGLVGSFLLDRLLNDDRYDTVRVFSRRPLDTDHAKLQVVESDLQDLTKIREHIAGHELYCCLGTTIKKAGSQAAFRAVDYELPVAIAALASQNGVLHFLVISSLGANPNTSNFYLRTKGEMEMAVTRISFARRTIVRPSALLGPRKESRPLETLGQIGLKLVRPFLLGKLKRYRAIHVRDVAKGMIAIANSGDPKSIYESHELYGISKG